MTIATTLPDFNLTCLNTAEFKSTTKAFEGKNTVIDFWTTKCVRCPAALDNLNSMATDSKYSKVEFNSIVLDECDGARHIIEQSDELRWKNVNHYYMDKEQKETAKMTLGFNQVPFYIVLNEQGEIVQKGSKKEIDFDAIPGIERPIVEVEIQVVEETKEMEETLEAIPKPEVETERVFCMDDFDF